jgi:beta-galactosidase
MKIRTALVWLLVTGSNTVLADTQQEGATPSSGAEVEPPPAEPEPAVGPAQPETPSLAESPTAYVLSDAEGQRLIYQGQPYLVRGMNWGYMPIGQNYSYDFWGKSDAFIEEVLHREMTLLRDMGVNSIRQYDVIPPRWVSWIYENYGITTMINNLVGRYGLLVNGAWIPVTNYADPGTRSLIIGLVRETVERYKDTPGVLLWLLGNENNYGLHWSSFEIEALPQDNRDEARARHLYSLYGELVDLIHELDPEHPVSIANGDLQYIDLIAEQVPDLDILGTNIYRGISARDLYEEVEEKLGIPVLYSEFGADAYDARRQREDSVTQARYLVGQWQEIYEQSHGKGQVGNAIGGYTFQWADGWWKFQQETNLDVHDNNASWPNEGYPDDFLEGQNNMNEEWFGICAKGHSDAQGHFEVYPRPAYYALQQAYTLDAYALGTDIAAIQSHFGAIRPADYEGRYDVERMKQELDTLRRARVAGFRFEQSNFLTDDTRDDGEGRARTEFDHMETLYVDLVGEPTEKVRAEVSLSVLGHVAQNRIDELFYESQGGPVELFDAEGESLSMTDLNRLRIYRATLDWDHPGFNIQGYFREGHYHWGNEGDFFGLYREAYYGPNIDIYNANVPIGIEVTAKKKLDGLKFALGPQVYWGANPQVIAKYQHKFGRFDTAVVHQEDITAQTQTGNSQVVPEQVTRKSTVYAGFDMGPVRIDMGGIAAGNNKVGTGFTRVVEAAEGEASYADSGYHVIEDEIQASDVFGGRLRAQAKLGPVQWFAQGGYQGLVADGGEDRVTIFTGWRLRPSGQGNQVHAQTGLTLAAGWLQIAPNFLWQKPLVGPNPGFDELYSDTGIFYPGMRPRNVVTDPFQVLGNRETVGGELLLVWDPTPGTWFWYWDNPQREDARFAGSLDFVYRHQPTSRDGNLAFTETGTIIQFDSSPPAQDEWSVDAQIIANPGGGLHIISGAYLGENQATGDDDRLVRRYGAHAELWWASQAAKMSVKIDDWGPYDYHRVFNLTYPLQLGLDYSLGVSAPSMEWAATRFGVQGKFRTRDEFSAGSELLNLPLDDLDHEWEVGTYLIFGM